MIVACEVECPFCRRIVALASDTVGHTVPCPECAGRLALVAPIPTVPVVPPAAPDFPSFSLAGGPPGHRFAKATARLDRLLPPWPRVLYGLELTRRGAFCMVPLYALFVMTDAVIFPLAPPNPFPNEGEHLALFVAVQLLPLVLHSLGQRACAVAPVRGNHLARRAVRLQVVGGAVLIGFSYFNRAGIALFVLLLLSSFALWLGFLVRLVRALDDRALSAEVRAFVWRYGIGVAMALALFAGLNLALRVNNWSVAFLCRASAALIGFVLLYGYDQLLRAVARSISLHAPVTGPTGA
ncbi:MAG TPA: hypothetical protein VGE74_21095 [Gemmata sp.]